MRLQFEVPDNCTMPKVVIRGRFHGEKTFPSLNNLLSEYGRLPVAGGRMKRKHQETCEWIIRTQIRDYKAQKPLIIHYRYFEPSRGQKRDYANIHAFCSKVFNDALQTCKIIPDDSPRWVLNETHDFFYAEKGAEPYIEIYLEEVDI